MKEEILNVEKNDRREYVSLSVKVVDIHLSDCINNSEPITPMTVDGGNSEEIGFFSGSVSKW